MMLASSNFLFLEASIYELADLRPTGLYQNRGKHFYYEVRVMIKRST
jgi:hypothetical protein